MSVISKVLNTAYTVGSQSSTTLPVNVTLKVDPDFKKTIYKTVTIFTVGIALGITAGIYISKKRR